MLRDIYLEPTEDIITRMLPIEKTRAELKEKYGLAYCRGAFEVWKKKRSWIPIQVVQAMFNLSDEEIWSFIDGRRIKGLSSAGPMVFRKEITRGAAVIFGWILSDGCIPQHKLVSVFISQSNLPALNRLRQTFLNAFEMDPQHVIIREFKGKSGYESKKQQYLMTINSKIFKKLLLEYYGFLSGRDKKKQIPSIILNSNTDIKKAFIAGFLEGDGNIYWLKRRARVMITCKCKSLAEQLKSICSDCKYRLNILHHRQKDCYILQTHLSETIARIIVNSINYFVHPDKIRNIQQVLNSDMFFRKLRINPSKEYRYNLVLDALRNIKGNTKQERFDKLAKLLQGDVNFDLKLDTIRGSWKNSEFTIPLGAFIKLHIISGRNYNNSILDWQSKFINLRGGYDEVCSVM